MLEVRPAARREAVPVRLASGRLGAFDPRFRSGLLRALVLLLVSACAGPALQTDEEPAPPARRGELIEFYVAATSNFRFFIDANSLSVDHAGIVRYVLVARSNAGVDNVSFEGMRCTTGEVRIYAVGRDGAWVGRPTDWRPIEPRSVQRWHNALYREYFCPQREPIASASEGVWALRQGGHPLTKGLSTDPRFGAR